MGVKGDWRRPIEDKYKKAYEQTMRRLYDKCSICSNASGCTTIKKYTSKCQQFIEINEEDTCMEDQEQKDKDKGEACM